MIKKFGQYINESKNPINKGDVVEVISIFGQTEDELPEKTAKYIGRIYIVDNIDNQFGKIETLGSGTWSIQDVRKLSTEEVKKRQPEIDEIISQWDNKKAEHKANSIKKVRQNLKNLGQIIELIDEDIEIAEETITSSNKYKLTLRIEKLG